MTTPKSPGIYGWYPSSFCSPWYVWFCQLGYPQLDINRYPDGEWEIIEYRNAPIIPSLTSWTRVLQGMRNVEISFGFVEKYVHQIDPARPEFWDREARKTAAMLAEQDALDKHREEYAEHAFRVIRGNEALMERIYKEGLKAINLWEIRKHIPGYREPKKEKPWLM